MKLILLAAAMLVASSSLTFGQTSRNKASRTGNIEQAIRQFLNESAAALGRNDAIALDRFYADDWTFVNSFGAVVTKAQRLSDLRSGDLKYESIGIDEANIRMYGDTAVATARMTISGQNRGRDLSGQYRVTTVIVKVNGRRQIVAQQSNRITQ